MHKADLSWTGIPTTCHKSILNKQIVMQLTDYASQNKPILFLIV